MSFVVRLPNDVIAVDPGTASAVALEVTNSAEGQDSYEIRIEGLDAQWTAIPDASFAVGPGETQVERIFIKPPRDSESTAGTYPFVVTIRSLVNGESRSVQGLLEVRVFQSLSIDVLPRRARVTAFSRECTFQVKLVNLGNAEQILQMFASDSDAMFAFEFESDQVAVGPGQERVISLASAASNRPLFANSRLQNFTVSARNVENPALGATASGQIEQRALFAPSALIALIAIFSLGALWISQWPKQPLITSLSISSDSVRIGDPVTVRWKAANADAVNVKIGDWEATRQTPDGSLEFTPTKAGTFSVELTAVNGRVQAKDASKTILVTERPTTPAPVVKAWVDRASVPVGQAYILKYKFNDAVTQATLFPMQRELDVRGDGIELTANTPGTVTLRVIAANAEGQTAEAKVDVTFVEPPDASIVKFAVEPRELEPGGGTVTLEWTVTKASRIEILYAGQKLVQSELTGTAEVSLTQDAAFKLVAYDANGRTVSSELVRVKVKPTPEKPVDPPLPDTQGGG